MDKIVDKLKVFFSKKINLISTIVFVLILLVIILVLVLKKDDKFTLNSIYNVYPEDVKALYSNMVEVSCYGDLHLDIELDNGTTDVTSVKTNNLIDYMFSYLDKEDKLGDEFSFDIVKDATDKLFYGDIDFRDNIDKYVYGNYVYTLKNGMVTREKGTCSSDFEYVSQLYGYSFNEDMLSVDVNIGYSKNGILYDLSDKKLGEYNGDPSELGDIFINSSYYRFNYVLDGKDYKLKSVEWNVRY